MLELTQTTTDEFYHITKIPMFILDNQRKIINQSQNFYNIPPFFFHTILSSSLIRKGKLDIFWNKTDVTFFISCHNKQTIVLGPIIVNYTYQYKSVKDIVIFNLMKVQTSLKEIYEKCTYFNDISFSYICMLYFFITQDTFSQEDFRQIMHNNKTSENNNLIYNNIINKRDYENKIYTYIEQQKFYQHIKNGDSLSARTSAIHLINNQSEPLSNDEFKNKKYRMIACITLMTQQVIEEKVTLEDAYSISDVYIKKTDQSNTPIELNETFMRCIIDFCTLVKKTKTNTYPFWIRNCIEYINQNLHKNIQLSDLAEHVHMNPQYISVNFKKITGLSFLDYQNKQKIEESKFLLQTTHSSITEIAETLNFSSQSYFTKIFKKYTHMLPKQYRNKMRRF